MNLFFSDFLCIFAQIRIFIVELKGNTYEEFRYNHNRIYQ